MSTVEQIVHVTVESTKTERTYDAELKDKNVQSVVYLRGLQGAKGEPGEPGTANVKAVTSADIAKLFI